MRGVKLIMIGSYAALVLIIVVLSVVVWSQKRRERRRRLPEFPEEWRQMVAELNSRVAELAGVVTERVTGQR